MSSEIAKKLKQIMSVILSIDENSINNDTSIKNVATWDSLKHVELIVTIEEKLQIEIDENEIFSLNSMGKILNYIEKIK